MLRKPSYCCNCGDRVERLEWHLWNSRRYCELCETEFVFDEWWPRGVIIALVLFGFTGVGFHLSGGKQPARLDIRNLSVPDRTAPFATKTNSAAPERKTKGPRIENDPADTQKPTPVRVEPGRGPVRSAPGKERDAKAEATPERVSYCGALTKKGKPCTRRVKGGGRCWQHVDSP